MVTVIGRVTTLSFLILAVSTVGTQRIACVGASSQLTDSRQEKLNVAAVSPTAPPAAENASLDPSFRIGADDVLTVNVWREPEVSQTVTVRPDGKISIPLIGEMVAAGLTPKQLEATIKRELSNYLSLPEVTVIVHEVKSQRVVVAGQVAKPGSYPLQTPMTVLDAIAQAGGPLEFAKVRSIYVLRIGPDGRPIRLRFNYKEVIKGRKLSQNVQLEPHDTLIVP
jgi:polysaccharide export outer membrane protein